MKSILQRLLVLLVLAAPLCGQERTTGDSCLDKANTQYEMDICAAQGFDKADAEMNRVYQQILTKYAANPSFIRRMKLAQEAWIKFRDAHMDALYYDPEDAKDSGSVYPMCKQTEATSLTLERLEALKRILGPQPEGEVCRFG
ncbi:MAG: lysozyme inhibitor LprI family protein [Candidatus Acidiferrales bacterium]